MKRMRSTTLAVVAVLTLVAGCSSSTSPIMDTISFEGVLSRGERLVHPLVLTDAGTIVFQFTLIEEVPVEDFEPLDFPWRLGLGIGRPSGDECATTFSASLSVGETLVLGLNDAEYCVAVFEPSFLPEERLLQYTMTASPGNQ